VTKADQECQALTHAGQWVETIDPSISAMKAALQANATQSGEILKTLVANFSQLHQQQKDGSRYRPNTRPTPRQTNQQTPAWVYDQPSYPAEIRQYNGKYWHFCTKCSTQGRWVCTHTDDTHEDSAYSSCRLAVRDNYDRPYHHSRSPSRDSHHRGKERRLETRSRSRLPGNQSYSSNPSSPYRHVTWQQQAPPTPVAKLSVLESINLFMDDHE